MALDARSRSSIYQKLVPTLGEHDANVLMSEFPSVEADELVTKQFLRAELSEFRASFEASMDARFAAADDRFEARFVTADDRFEARFATMDTNFEARFATMDTRFATNDFVRAEMADMRASTEAQLHRQTARLGSGLAAATAFLAALGALT